MTKLKALGFFCVSLIAINLTLVWLFVLNKPKRPPDDGPKMLVIKRLNFDGSQIKKYEKLINWHKTEISKAENDLFNLKNKLYSTLIEEDSDPEKDTLVERLNKIQKKIEQIHYKHFSEIKQICRKDQRIYFEELTHDISNLFQRQPTK